MDYSYDELGKGYSSQRRTDPGIHAQIQRQLGDARTVLNVGAGTGSYEQCDRLVMAVEPSSTMRAQRPINRPAINASAELLPFDDNSFDACMTILSIHHWRNPAMGLREMKRVSRKRIVILSYDPQELERFWLFQYLPELADIERRRFPDLESVGRILGMEIQVSQITVPSDCIDSFNEAFFARPECFLDAKVRAGQSAWALLGKDIEQRFVQDLERDLASGAWDTKYGGFRHLNEFCGAIRIWRAEHATS